MRVSRFLAGVAAGIIMSSTAALAEDIALVFGEQGQIQQFKREQGTRPGHFTAVLRGAGFRVIEPRDRSAASMRRAAQAVETVSAAGQLDRLVIVAQGPFAGTGYDSWVLSNEAAGASGISIAVTGISLNALSDLAAGANENAVILIAPGRRISSLGQGLRAGLGDYVRAEDVTYVTGPADLLAGVLADDLLVPGVSFAEAAQAAPPAVAFSGYVSRRQGLMGAGYQAVSPQDVESGFWQAVRKIETPEAYAAYLEAYPSGPHTGEARERIDWLRNAPLRQAMQDEKALRLSREARREIQRNLALLEYDPRGIDGVLGRGSRAAIAAWQRDSGFDDTGFLNGNQVLQLKNQARARSDELEAEALRHRQEAARRDRGYWRETGRSGQESDLRAYLEKYPDGEFSDIARSRLKEIENARLQEAERYEREAWDAAEGQDTEEGYQAFLQQYPNSGFAGAAQTRLREIRSAKQTSAQARQAKKEEAQLASTGVARMLIERRLAAMGLNPGPADGKFTKQTRRAIRRFQRERGIEPTGFVSKQTMVSLLAGR